jgi:hypothetical protein
MGGSEGTKREREEVEGAGEIVVGSKSSMGGKSSSTTGGGGVGAGLDATGVRRTKAVAARGLDVVPNGRLRLGATRRRIGRDMMGCSVDEDEEELMVNSKDRAEMSI